MSDLAKILSEYCSGTKVKPYKEAMSDCLNTADQPSAGLLSFANKSCYLTNLRPSLHQVFLVTLD